MYKATGPGKFEIFFDAPGAGVLEARLYDFDFDDFAGRIFRPLKSLHAQFLTQRVILLLANHKGNIWLQGSASRIGPKNWNMELSQVRESSVQAYLLNNNIMPDQIEPHAVGNMLTVAHALDDAHDRCVLLWIRPRYDFQPSLPKKVPAKPKLSSTFKIAVDGQYSAVWMTHHREYAWRPALGRRFQL